jgi:hypothetical protein
MNKSLINVGYEATSMAKIFGTRGSGSNFRQRLVFSHSALAVSSARRSALDTNTRAHKVDRGGTLVKGKVRVEYAEDDGLFCCADGKSASEGAAKGIDDPVRCLFARGFAIIAHYSGCMCIYRSWRCSQPHVDSSAFLLSQAH